jgi:hypothetical protein
MTPVPYRAADSGNERFGALVESYGRSKRAALRSVAIMGFLLLMGLEACLSSLDGLDDRAADTSVVGMLVGATALLVATFFARRMLALRGLRLELREHGLVYRVRRAETVMLWDDVSSVTVTRRNIRRWARDRCVLVARDGGRLVLSDPLQNIAALCSRVEEETVRRLLPRAMADLQAGHALAFGPFEVTKDGLAHASRGLAWNDVADALAMKGVLVVSDRHGIRVLPKRDGIIAWAKAPCDQVPNAAVLLRLVQQLKGASMTS